MFSLYLAIWKCASVWKHLLKQKDLQTRVQGSSRRLVGLIRRQSAPDKKTHSVGYLTPVTIVKCTTSKPSVQGGLHKITTHERGTGKRAFQVFRSSINRRHTEWRTQFGNSVRVRQTRITDRSFLFASVFSWRNSICLTIFCV